MKASLKFRVARLRVARHFEAEINGRLEDPEDVDSERFDRDYIISVLEVHDGDADEKFRFEAEKSRLPRFCIVMEQGERNLDEAIRAENLKAKPLVVCAILYELAQCRHHIHSRDYVHGDFKLRNIVRQTDDRRWNAIDFDGSVEIGEPMGLKVSTAYIPPEMVTLENRKLVVLAKCSCPDRAIVAHPSFDVWSFGVIMFQLLTPEKQHLFDGVDPYDSLDEKNLKRLARWNHNSAKDALVVMPPRQGVVVVAVAIQSRRTAVDGRCSRP